MAAFSSSPALVDAAGVASARGSDATAADAPLSVSHGSSDGLASVVTPGAHKALDISIVDYFHSNGSAGASTSRLSRSRIAASGGGSGGGGAGGASTPTDVDATDTTVAHSAAAPLIDEDDAVLGVVVMGADGVQQELELVLDGSAPSAGDVDVSGDTADSIDADGQQDADAADSGTDSGLDSGEDVSDLDDFHSVGEYRDSPLHKSVFDVARDFANDSGGSVSPSGGVDAAAVIVDDYSGVDGVVACTGVEETKDGERGGAGGGGPPSDRVPSPSSMYVRSPERELADETRGVWYFGDGPFLPTGVTRSVRMTAATCVG
jgi:hypothetical protein